MKTSEASFVRFILFAFLLVVPPDILAAEKQPTIVLIAGEHEYQSTNTLPAFKKYLEASYPVHCVYLERKDQDIPGLEALDQADLAIVFIRRMTLPAEQLGRIQKYANSGKPLICLRTTSHAFENWKEFDRDVLGGNYHNHYGSSLVATAKIHRAAAAHPILKNVAAEFVTGGSLYRTSPLAAGATVLLMGNVPDQAAEPMAWTHTYKGARVFYTSLGHPKDFENPSFRRMLVNAIFWALNEPVPPPKQSGPLAAATLKPGPPKNVGADEFEKLWRENKYVVLDVRTPKEYDAGHIPGAVLLDFNAADFENNVAALDRDKVYLVHCAGGVRSAKACAKMRQLKFPYLYNLEGGLKSWEKAGKPVER